MHILPLTQNDSADIPISIKLCAVFVSNLDLQQITRPAYITTVPAVDFWAGLSPPHSVSLNRRTILPSSPLYATLSFFVLLRYLIYRIRLLNFFHLRCCSIKKRHSIPCWELNLISFSRIAKFRLWYLNAIVLC